MFSNSNYGPSLADIAAVTDGNKNNNGFWGGDGIWAIIIFAMIFGWGNGGFGFGGNGNGALTRADLCQDMNFQGVENGVRGIQQGLCDGFYAQNTTMLNGFNGVQRDLCTGFANVNAGINQARFDNQQCCCETNRNIDAVRYENAKNTCDIIQSQNAGVQRILDKMCENEIQGLRDQLQTANFQLSQQAQNSTLINQLRPCPIPAYLSCSPYQSYNPFGNGYGCGNNNGCGCC